MRVLHVHEQARFHGGVEQILHDLAGGLAAGGWPQALLFDAGTACDDFQAPFSIATTELAAALRFKPDVVVLHKWSNEDPIRALMGALPCVQVVHDHDLYCPRRHKYFPISHATCTKRAGGACIAHLCLLERRAGIVPVGIRSLSAHLSKAALARRAQRLVAGSRYSAQELQRNDFPAGNIDVIAPVPAAIDLVHEDVQGESGRMLFVGQAIRGKGLDLLLRAAAAVKLPWELDVIGTGRQLDEYRQLAAELGIAERVHFAGWVPHRELGQWYQRASFSVVPSRWPEPFGMVGLEAMTHARAVVAFDSGGIRDWLQDATCGLLVPPADVAALARALVTLISDPDHARAMGRQALRHCRERYTHAGYLQAMQRTLQCAAMQFATQPRTSHERIAAQFANT